MPTHGFGCNSKWPRRGRRRGRRREGERPDSEWVGRDGRENFQSKFNLYWAFRFLFCSPKFGMCVSTYLHTMISDFSANYEYGVIKLLCLFHVINRRKKNILGCHASYFMLLRICLKWLNIHGMSAWFTLALCAMLVCILSAFNNLRIEYALY